MRSSSSGVPSRFSSRLVGRLALFHGQRADTSGSSPTAVNQRSSGQRPWLRRISSIPARGIFSTGLPSTQPTARPSQAAYTRSRRASGSGAGIRGATRSPTAATMADQLLGSSTSLGAGIASSSSSSWRASATCSGLAGSGEAPAARGPIAPPAATHRRSTSATSRPSSADCASSLRSRSSGCDQVTRTSVTGLRGAACRAPNASADDRGRLVGGEELGGHLGHGQAARLRGPTGTPWPQSPPSSAGTVDAPPSAPAIAPPMVAIESESRP